MNKRILIFALVCSVSVVQSLLPINPIVYAKRGTLKNDMALRKFCSSYMASLLLSGCVGLATGSIVRYLEKRFDIEASPIALFLYILSWTFESEIRNDIIIGLQADLDSNHVGYKKNLMFKSAWLASWIGYCFQE